MSDLRPRWCRWLVPRGAKTWLAALSIAWFVVGLVAFIATEAAYGWVQPPIHHAWHAVAWLVFSGWIFVGERLHRPRLSRSPVSELSVSNGGTGVPCSCCSSSSIASHPSTAS